MLTLIGVSVKNYFAFFRIHCYLTALKASSRSSMISSICSVPIDSRIVFGRMPACASSSSFIWECVVLAGWITSDFTSATFANKENSSRLSIKSFAFCASPRISKVKIEPPPFGKYFFFQLLLSCVRCDGRMMHRLYLRMAVQIFYDFQGVFHMAFYP